MSSKLATNVMHFTRVLRHAGLPVGPRSTLDAVEAVEAVGVRRRDDFYWALRTVLVHERSEHEIFDRAFELFWRNPGGMDAVMAALLPKIEAPSRKPPKRTPRRLAEALAPKHSKVARTIERDQAEPMVDATMTWSGQSVSKTRDFDDMSTREIAEAKSAIARMQLPLEAIATRRYEPRARGKQVDMRATLRANARAGGLDVALRWRSRRERLPALVVVCDVSGSMDRYARMLLHFVHRLASERDRVSCFVFGTHLTNVTRHLRNRDVDVALASVGSATDDWGGGTRIGACLHELNQRWTRRVMGQGAVVLLVTDGLDREGAEGITREMERLRQSCRRLIWLNPLLRFDAFEAKTAGARAIAPHVDDRATVHDLRSLEQLASTLDARVSRVRRVEKRTV